MAEIEHFLSCETGRQLLLPPTDGSEFAMTHDAKHSRHFLVPFLAQEMALCVTGFKCILRYLRGTTNQSLVYSADGGELCVNSDADYAGDAKTRRSTNGFVSLIGGTAVSWNSQLQKSVALSTTEAEFVAANEEDKELVWLSRLLEDISTRKTGIPSLLVDNMSAIKLVRNQEFHKCSKHIAVRYFFVQELYVKGGALLNLFHLKDNCERYDYGNTQS